MVEVEVEVEVVAGDSMVGIVADRVHMGVV